MADDIAITVEHVSKDFLLPHEKVSSVKSAFTGIFNRSRTKEVQHALKDISFEIKKGEFFGIVGRNGSGKSTMLKILANIYQPTKGKVHTAGKLVPFIELGVGFNPELTGRENVYLNGAMLGFSRKEIDAMYSDIVAFAELERFMDQKLKNYSSGMQVRLAFSMATRSQADILLIDEVLAVGDADFQRKCFEYFKSLKADKKTVIFVSHDMSAVREYCDRALLLEDSRLRAIGSADEVAQEHMKQFMDSGVTDNASKGDSSWGTKQVKTLSVHVADKNGTISIEHTFRIADANTLEVVPGFRIRDVSGVEILGTNTKREGVSLGEIHKGRKITVEWKVPNILSDGTFLIDVALVGGDEITVFEWFDNAATLTVRKLKHVPYAIDPGYSVVVK